MFADSDSSRALGRAHWARLIQLKRDRIDPEQDVDVTAVQAQLAANDKWANGPDSALPRLHSLEQPVLIGNGAFDIMVPTVT
jgi:hypothetical protein